MVEKDGKLYGEGAEVSVNFGNSFTGTWEPGEVAGEVPPVGLCQNLGKFVLGQERLSVEMSEDSNIQPGEEVEINRTVSSIRPRIVSRG